MLVYSAAIWFYSRLFALISIFHGKAKKRVLGLEAQKSIVLEPCDILVHCASAGEYEQANQIIQSILDQKPTLKIALSFFSPSGIEWVEKKNIALPYYYLPFDLQKNQREFIDQLNPKVVLITKNELWFNLFSVLQKRKISIFIIAASFKKNHFALKINPLRQILQKIDHLYLIDEEDKTHLGNSFSSTSIEGDPRIDQIINKTDHVSSNFRQYSKLSKPIIIYASIHKEDAQIVANSILDKNFYHLVVPHDVDDASISYWQSKFNQPLSLDSNGEKWNEGIRLVDSMGKLAQLYSISEFCYVGGGFGKGIHNIIEPASRGNLIFIGPNYYSFKEARDLVGLNAVQVVRKNDNIAKKSSLIDSSQKNIMREKLTKYIREQKGSSLHIAKDILSRIHDIK